MDLFRAGIPGRVGAKMRLAAACELQRKRAGDAEIDQPDFARGVDQNVFRFQVQVGNHVPVGKCDRGADS